MPRASRKQVYDRTPTGWAGPGRLARRPDPPIKVALKKKMKGK